MYKGGHMELYQLINKTLLKSYRIIREEKDKVIPDDALNTVTYNQFNILYWIDSIENPTITELAKVMKMTKPTMTVHIQNLEKLGLTFKEKAEDDKRKSYIRISELGRKKIEKR